MGSVALDGMRDQAKHREFAVWFDQHKDTTFKNAAGDRIFEYGRPYWSTTEKSTKMPVGPVYRMNWVAPWEPPQAYIVASLGRIPKMEGGAGLMPKGTLTDRFRIDYAQMVTDDREAMRVYHQAAVRKAADLNLPIPRLGAVPDSRLIAIIGPPPRDPRIAQAAMAGNKWLLGQLAPTWNADANRMEVEEDEGLAKLLQLLNPAQETYEDMERAAEAAEKSAGPVPDGVQELMAEFRAMQARIAELEGNRKADAPKNKGGRPRKDATKATEAAP